MPKTDLINKYCLLYSSLLLTFNMILEIAGDCVGVNIEAARSEDNVWELKYLAYPRFSQLSLKMACDD